MTGARWDYQERIVHQHVEQVVEVHVPMTQDPLVPFGLSGFGSCWGWAWISGEMSGRGLGQPSLPGAGARAEGDAAGACPSPPCGGAQGGAPKSVNFYRSQKPVNVPFV